MARGNLTRYTPFNDMARFDPLRNFEDFFREFSMMPSLTGMAAEPHIKLDIAENDKAYLVKAEVPGVRKEDIQVAVDGNQVTIQANRQEEKEEKEGGNIVRRERHIGQQFRSFSLPQDVDDSKVEARYQDGILSLTLPKKEGSGAKRISIQ